MALVKSKKTTSLSLSLPIDLKSEMDGYAAWADVSADDIVAHALELLFKEDLEWAAKKKPAAPSAAMGKTALVREVYAEIAAGKHPHIAEKAGEISSGSVFKAIKEVYGRDDIAYGTCTAQTSLMNRLVRNEYSERSNQPNDWEPLCARVEALGGKID